MLPQRFWRTFHLLTTRLTQDTQIAHTLFMDAPSPCFHSPCWHCHQCQAPAAPSSSLGGDAVPRPGQDLDVLQPSFHRKLRILLLSSIGSITSSLQELYTIIIYRAKPYLFLLCNVTNLYSTEAQFSDVPTMMHFHYFELASPFHFASFAGFHFK